MNQNYARLLLALLPKIGADKNFKILDLGCGNGDTVRFLCDLGYDAYGMDVEFKEGEFKEQLVNEGRIKLIGIGQKSRADLDEGDEYVWPDFGFKFDLIISRAVVEHVRNLKEFVESTSKSLNNNGVVLHYYPSKASLIEPHTGVPFGALLTNELWFKLMCSLGVCYSKYKRRWSEAFLYMENFTLFRWQSEIDKCFASGGFGGKKDLTHYLLATHPSKLWRFLSKFKLAVGAFNVLRSKVIYYEK